MRKKTFAAGLILMMLGLANGFQSAAGWVKYDSAEGRYSVLLPQQPKLSSQQSMDANGDKVQQYLAQASDSDGMYMAGYFDVLPGKVYSLDNGRDGIINAVKGTLLSEEAVSLGGHPGRELKILVKTPDYEFLIRGRLYLIEGRVYMLEHIFLKSSDTPAMAGKTDKFFDSFKVAPRK